MNQTSRVLLALVVFLSMGCRKLAVDVGDATDAGPDSAAGGAGGGDTGPTAGTGGAGTSGTSTGWTEFEVLQAAQRKIDILFVVDNSRSMDPKQVALAQNFPKMIGALEQLPDGLPDIHVGVVSSDMGAGGGEQNFGCEWSLGNQGILWGNDPNVDPTVDRNKYATVKHLKTSGGLDGCGMGSGARWIEDILNPDGITRDKNYQGKLTDVFSCLATAVGTSGCEYEHQLQSLRVALNWQADVNPQNSGFLRDGAFLAIVIISDEDDCSAEPDWRKNDKVFVSSFSKSTGSLRCAARGHVCNGQNIPNFDPETGYTGTAPFEANLSDCAAKDVVRQPPAESDPTYAQLPLIRVQDMIDTVKALKPRPAEQILVSGIIGWPQDNKLDGVKYRIDKDPTSPGAQSDLWDYMPLCSIPELTSGEGDNKNIYKAYAGLRLKKFIDGFSNGQVHSICNPEGFSSTMQKIGQQIGNAVAKKLKPACITHPLVDSNPSLAETQPECRVTDKIPCDDRGVGECREDGYEAYPVPQCIDPTTGNPLSPTAPAKANIPDDARPCWYLVHDTDPNTGCPTTSSGQKIVVARKGDGIPRAGTYLVATCRTCASATDPLCASH